MARDRVADRLFKELKKGLADRLNTELPDKKEKFCIDSSKAVLYFRVYKRKGFSFRRRYIAYISILDALSMPSINYWYPKTGKNPDKDADSVDAVLAAYLSEVAQKTGHKDVEIRRL